MRRSITQARDVLQHSVDAVTRSTAQLRMSHSQMTAASQPLLEKVEQGVRHLNSLLELRVYLSELVGMLREKEGMIRQLKSAVLALLSSGSARVAARRVEIQEDRCYLAKMAAGRDATVDYRHYEPTGMLLAAEGADAEREQEAERGIGASASSVDEFGRSRGLQFGSQAALQARHARRKRVQLHKPPPASALARGARNKKGGNDNDNNSNSNSNSNKNNYDDDDGGGGDGGDGVCYYASDEEVPESERASAATKASTLRQAAAVVLADARTELRSLEEILARIASFRTALPDRFRAAYIGLSLPGKDPKMTVKSI